MSLCARCQCAVPQGNVLCKECEYEYNREHEEYMLAEARQKKPDILSNVTVRL